MEVTRSGKSSTKSLGSTVSSAGTVAMVSREACEQNEDATFPVSHTQILIIIIIIITTIITIITTRQRASIKSKDLETVSNCTF